MRGVCFCVRRVVVGLVVLLAGNGAWAMQPGKEVPRPDPNAKADPVQIGISLRQGAADYAAYRATHLATGQKEPVPAAVFQAAPGAVSTAPQTSVAAMRATRPDLHVRFDAQTGAAVTIKGANLLTAGRMQSLSRAGATGPAVTAMPPLADVTGAASEDGLDTLDACHELLKIHQARQEFARKTCSTDALGLTHVQYQQLYKGLPVWNKQVWVHLDQQGSSYLVEGRTEPTPTSVTTQPRITALQAIDRVSADLGEARDPTAELVIHIDDWDISRLAWHVTTWRQGQRWQYFVDAFFGAILHRTCDTRYETVTGTGVDLLGNDDTFSAWHQGSTYYLLDASMPMHVYDPVLPNDLGTGNLVVFDGQHQDPNSNITAYFFTEPSPTAGWDAAGVSVLDHFRTITQYYKNTHNRNGIDGQSLNALAFAHVGTGWDNAAWTGQVIVLGDGQQFLSLARSLDVIAHEYTHGVVEYTANFEYQFQSGALHEAFADIMACMIDRRNWTMGEDIVRSGPPLRDLANPHAGLDSAPATMDEYQALSINDDLGGVHINATIPGHAAYMMADGLTNGIGRDKVERIFYRALTLHMTSQSSFADCRAATIQSAEELYGVGGAEAKAAADAWDAVKVTASTTGGGGGGSAEIPPIQGPDSLVFVARDASNNPRLIFATQGKTYYVSSVTVSLSRPVVIFGGSQVLYIDAGNNLREASLSPSDTYDVPVKGGTNIRTICGSRDGKYLAFTDTSMDDKLYLVDLHDPAGDKTFTLYMPSIDGGQTTSMLDHADALDFDISNTHILFDALNHFSVQGTTQQYQFWGVGILDVGTGNVTSAVSAQPQGISVGNPCASSTQDWIIAVDIVDDTAGTCQTRVVNLKTNKSGLVASQNNTVDLGWASFNGDDTSVALQYGGEIVNVPIAAQGDGTVVGDFSKEQALEASAYLPRYYRTGQTGGKPHITLSTTSLDFGDMQVGTTASLQVTVGNTGNYPLTISGITFSGSAQFSHDGSPREIPAGYELDVTVSFSPTAAGSAAGTLAIRSDDPDTAESVVQISGNGVGNSSSGGGNGNGNGTGSGTSSPRCFIATAAYGSYLEPHVVALRTFRDEHLLTNAPGCAFVAAYYRCSPPIAAFIARHESLRTATRGLLTPIVLAVQYPEPVGLAALALMVSGVVAWRRRRQLR
jgi:bacillolysin